jgi:probable F420-dependent oxidoreductase
MTARPFRFGLSIATAPSATEWLTCCREAEALGYTSILVPDHFNDQFAVIPALASAGAATGLRVGALVACNDYRHPVMYAKELATIDLLTEGRVEWGMGAGWLLPEYQQVGLPFDPGPERVTRLIEAVALMKALFADGPVTSEGPAYPVTGLDGRPKPVQRPHPPLLIGAAGRRMLRFAGREADIIGIAPSLLANPGFAGEHRLTGPEATDRQLGWIRAGAADRFDSVELNMVAFPTVVTDDRAGKAAEIGAATGIPAEEVVQAPHVWVGSIDEICASLEERRARWGVSYWVVPAAVRHVLAPVVERLAGR